MQGDGRVKSVRKEQVLHGYSDEAIGFSLTHSFLENGLKDENPESWILDVLSRTSEDNSKSNGVEVGRVKLLNPFLVKDSFVCSDFVDSALSKNYFHDTGSEEDLTANYSSNQYRIILNTMNILYNDDVWRCTNPDEGRSNRYKLEASVDDFTQLYESLNRVVFPSDELVEMETGLTTDQITVAEHVEEFPYAHNKHTESQLGVVKDRIIDERRRYFKTSLLSSN